jgi:hypothetical protein
VIITLLKQVDVNHGLIAKNLEKKKHLKKFIGKFTCKEKACSVQMQIQFLWGYRSLQKG